MRAHPPGCVCIKKFKMPALNARWTLPIRALRWPHAVENSLVFYTSGPSQNTRQGKTCHVKHARVEQALLADWLPVWLAALRRGRGCDYFIYSHFTCSETLFQFCKYRVRLGPPSPPPWDWFSDVNIIKIQNGSFQQNAFLPRNIVGYGEKSGGKPIAIQRSKMLIVEYEWWVV